MLNKSNKVKHYPFRKPKKSHTKRNVLIGLGAAVGTAVAGAFVKERDPR